MTGRNEQEKKTASTPTAEQMISTEESNNTPSTSGVNKLTLLIAVTALALTGYTQYSSTQLNTNLRQKNKELHSQLQQLQEEQNNQNQELNKKTTALENSKQELESKISAFTKQVQSLGQKGNQSQDWLLLQARYYLELAQINAHWLNTTNQQLTAALLQQAELTLAQMDAAELFKIRQIIAKELEQLKTANHLDLPDLLSQLDTIQTSIGKLHLQKPFSLKANLTNNTEQASATKPSDSTWKTQLNNNLNILANLVVIRRNNEEIKPLLSPVFESLLKESLHLNIQEAQWAILNQNPITYQLALKQAIATLQRGFNKHLADTNTLIQKLKKLEKINVVSDNIEVGQALPLINELIEQRQLINTKKTNKLGGQEE